MIAAYFPLAGLCSTVALKQALMDLLIDARADGSLLAEEGKQREAEEEEDEKKPKTKKVSPVHPPT